MRSPCLVQPSSQNIIPELSLALHGNPELQMVIFNLMESNPLGAQIESMENRFSFRTKVFTWDSTSLEYWQKGIFTSRYVDRDIFLVHLLGKMFPGLASTQYYWSRHLDRQWVRNKIQELVIQIHNYYFDHKIALSDRERRELLDLLRLHFAKIILFKEKPDVLLVNCLAGVDRTASFHFLLQLSLLHDKYYPNPIQDHEIFNALTNLLVPALQMFNRMIEPKRIARLMPVVRRLLSKPPLKLSP
jgi:hypothetical protein